MDRYGRKVFGRAMRGLAVVMFVILLLFAFWGGNPKGIFTKIDELKIRVESQEEELGRLRADYNSHRHTGIFGKVRGSK